MKPSGKTGKKVKKTIPWSLHMAIVSARAASFICKAKYILQEGYTPVDVDVVEVEIDDLLHKVGKTTGYTTGRVTDDSVYVWVSYGGFGNDSPFDDVIMTEQMIEGGTAGVLLGCMQFHPNSRALSLIYNCACATTKRSPSTSPQTSPSNPFFSFLFSFRNSSGQ